MSSRKQSKKSIENSESKQSKKSKEEEEEEESEVDSEVAYEEEVFRQIAKDEQEEPELAEIEIILRLKRRFRVTKTKTAAEQLGKVNEEGTKTILLLTAMVKKKLVSCWIGSALW